MQCFFSTFVAIFICSVIHCHTTQYFLHFLLEHFKWALPDVLLLDDIMAITICFALVIMDQRIVSPKNHFIPLLLLTSTSNDRSWWVDIPKREIKLMYLTGFLYAIITPNTRGSSITTSVACVVMIVMDGEEFVAVACKMLLQWYWDHDCLQGKFLF